MNEKGAKEKAEGFGSGAGTRMSAKSVIMLNIEREENHTDALKILLREIPWLSLSREDEGKLWRYFISR